MSDEEKTIENLRKNKGVSFAEADIILNLIDKLQKEIDEWQKAYIRENNYWLKFRNKINKIANNDKDCSDNAVIKAVKELKKENDKLTKLLLGKSLGFNDYISKKKIRKEIKELEEMTLDDDDIFGKMRSYAILILNKLVEE